MIALGLLILAAAGVVGVVGVLANDGASHELARSFDVLGYEFTGASGVLFLIGIVVGGISALGLAMVVSGLRHRARRSLGARRARKDAKGETKALAEERDELAEALEAERRKHDRSAALSMTEEERGTESPARAQQAVPPSRSPVAPGPADSSPVPASYGQPTGKGGSMPPPSNS